MPGRIFHSAASIATPSSADAARSAVAISRRRALIAASALTRSISRQIAAKTSRAWIASRIAPRSTGDRSVRLRSVSERNLTSARVYSLSDARHSTPHDSADATSGTPSNGGVRGISHAANLSGAAGLVEQCVEIDEVNLRISAEQLAHVVLSDSNRCDELAAHFGTADPWRLLTDALARVGPTLSISARVYYSVYSKGV